MLDGVPLNSASGLMQSCFCGGRDGCGPNATEEYAVWRAGKKEAEARGTEKWFRRAGELGRAGAFCLEICFCA